MTKQSPRLSNDNRPIIMKAVITHQLQPEYTALCERGMQIAEAYYLDLVPKNLRDLPDGVLVKASLMKLKVGDDIDEIHFNGQFQVKDSKSSYTSYSWFKDSPTIVRPMPYNKAMNVAAILSHDDPTIYYRQFKEHRQAIDAFNKKFNELRTEITGLLYSFSTVKTLIEAWPEVAPFIPDAIAPPKLPALPIAALNEKLGLP